MTVKELKALLEAVPEEAEVIMHLDSKGGRAFEAFMGKYFNYAASAVGDEDEDEVDLGLPYDGNCLLREKAKAEAGVFVLSDWRI